jgi:putative ABC transport system substrate-binding protein
MIVGCSDVKRRRAEPTGVNFLATEVAAKRLALLRELIPAAARVAVLVDPANKEITETTLREVEPAARAMGLQIHVLNASNGREIGAAFERERPTRCSSASGPCLPPAAYNSPPLRCAT